MFPVLWLIWNFLFFLFSYLSLVVSLSLCSLPFFSFPSSCYFSLVSINPFHLYAAFGELHTQTLFFFLCYSQLIWTGTFRFDKKSNPTLIILTYFPFCLPPFFFLFTDLAACSSKVFLSFAKFYRETHRNIANLFVVLNTHLCHHSLLIAYLFIHSSSLGETLPCFCRSLPFAVFPYFFSSPCLSIAERSSSTTTHIMRCDMLFNTALSLLLAARLAQAGPVPRPDARMYETFFFVLSLSLSLGMLLRY